LIARLRKKLEEDTANPRLVKTVRGIGYVFVPDVQAA
jgi:DNA-binding response OmpR family regulator